ncbi:hypothetical protein B0T13DRAFT_298051 [Neurospora crassa]|nr:hypothetical protein B0T13DRAFT_298051 [Neurospora crassa]
MAANRQPRRPSAATSAVPLLLYPLVAAVAPPSSPSSPSSSTAFLEVVCLLRPDRGWRSSYSTHLPLVLFSPRLSLPDSFSLLKTEKPMSGTLVSGFNTSS